MPTNSRGRRWAGFLLSSGLALLATAALAADEVITVFPASSSRPVGITAGPDGNMWFTEVGFAVGRITPRGVVTEFPVVPALDCTNGFPPGCLGRGIVAGPDGNLWFVNEASGPSTARVTTDGVVTGIPAVRTGEPRSIVAGADGNLWTAPWTSFAASNFICRVTPAGNATSFSIPSQAGEVKGAHSLAQGADGNVWFTEVGYGRIGRVTPSGDITQFSVRKGALIDSAAVAITSGPDGALWFTTTQKFIGRITTDGDVTGFPTPDFSSSSASGICSGPDSNLWFTESGPGIVARCSPSGVITEYPVRVGIAPYGIAAGPDGNIWFTLGPSYIGRVNLDVVAATEGAAPIPAVSPLGLILAGILVAITGFFYSRLSQRAA